ncbi:unnamed protein product, partial [marine sediment metagenome]
QLYDVGALDPQCDRVAWVAHRNELLVQAAECFDKYEDLYGGGHSCKSCLDFVMLGTAKTSVPGEASYRLVVIDEAHHGAAPSYQPMFRREDLGILGLTATPSRHDGQPLDF